VSATTSEKSTAADAAPTAPGGARGRTVVAWIVLLIVSDLPEILLRAAGQAPPPVAWPRIALLVISSSYALLWQGT
jgi:hypothetical protein